MKIYFFIVRKTKITELKNDIYIDLTLMHTKYIGNILVYLVNILFSVMPQ